MKNTMFLLLVVMCLFFAGAVPALAHSHVSGSIWIGPVWGPWWGPAAYPYPYYSPSPVVIQQQPPVYEEQAPQREEQPYYWYYCPESKTYYPYVKQCQGDWLKVIPTPASPE